MVKIKDAIKELYATFPKQPITELMCCKELEGADSTPFDDNGEELKRYPPLPLLYSESWVFMKENPDKKAKHLKYLENAKQINWFHRGIGA